jgi:hypothetical protein
VSVLAHPAPHRGPLLRLALLAVLIHLALRAVTAVMLIRASDAQAVFPPWTDGDPSYLDMTVLWDGSWYRWIAENGYPRALPTDAAGNLQQNAWAFYPAFPLTARLGMWLTGASFPLVGSTVALVAGAAAAGVIAVVLRRWVSPPLTIAAVAVWSAFPASPSLQTAYTESLAMLVLGVWLLALQRERWLLLGAMSVLMGLTRPIAVPLGLVLVVWLVVRWRSRTSRPWPLADRIGSLAALLVTGAAGFLWPAIAWAATGRSDAYTATMATWRAGAAIVPFRPWLDMSRWFWRDSPDADWLGPLSLVVVGVALLVLVLGPWAWGLGVELRAWCLAYPAYLAVVLDPFTSIFRYLIPLFPLAAVVVGGGLRGRPGRRRTTIGVAVAAVLVGLGVRGQWEWITELLVFNPPTDYPP